MKKFRVLLFIAILCFLADSKAEQLVGEPIQPIVALRPSDEAKVDLGRKLFHEKALSSDRSVSCASCHNLSINGATSTRFGIGVGGAIGTRNVPTVFNSSLNFRQFWDGRANTLEGQVSGPIENKFEMASTWPEVVERLRASAEYMNLFTAVFGTAPSKSNVTEALASFERTLITPNSKFDRYLNGETSAINEREKIGYSKFKSFGCVACHQGVNVGGNMFQTMGVMANYFEGKKETLSDQGRFSVTQKEKDRHVFRVPSLRNVARTAPYFHDGSEPTLAGAVKTMGRYQLGRELSEADIALIVEFLATLNGDLPPNASDASGRAK